MQTKFNVGDLVNIPFKINKIVTDKNTTRYYLESLDEDASGYNINNIARYEHNYISNCEGEDSRRGKWLTKQEPNDAEPIILYKCSRCDKELGMTRPIVDGKIVYNYCPFCGAKMKETEE